MASSTTPDLAKAKRYLTAQEAATRLGLSVSTFRSHAHLPAADVVLGESTGRPIYGWSNKTIDAWWSEHGASIRQRPGRARSEA